VEGGTLDFDLANVVSGIKESPYLLEGLNPGLHTLCLRAEDAVGNETTNVDFESPVVGVHPNVYWTEGPDMKVAHGRCGGFLYDGGFWVLGGWAAAAILDTVERYDIEQKTWSSPWTLPEPRDSFGCGAFGPNAFIFGGRFAETDVTDDVKVIDIATGNPLEIAIHMPEPRASMGCALLDGKFYLAGGRTYSSPDWVYHRDAYSFEPIPGPFVGETDMEYDTAMMGFASGEGYLMTCGGYPERSDVLYHVPGTKSWQFKTPLSYGREGNVSILVDGWFYTLGGSAGWMEVSEVDVYNVAEDTWYMINQFPNSRAFPAIASDGSYIYMAGGLHTAGPAYFALSSFVIGKIF
jgi:hypothetical protein